jgi:hypothetical protein
MRTSKYVDLHIKTGEQLRRSRHQEQEIEEILLESHIEEQTAILDEKYEGGNRTRKQSSYICSNNW